VGEAIGWLCDAFGFTLRIRIANHRVQLNVGDGAVVLTEQSVSELPDTTDADEPGSLRQGRFGHSVMVRVSDVDRHHERASKSGARILRPPADYPYDERQYTCEDHAGHRWTFAQSIKDLAPEEWGGTPGWIE